LIWKVGRSQRHSRDCWIHPCQAYKTICKTASSLNRSFVKLSKHFRYQPIYLVLVDLPLWPICGGLLSGIVSAYFHNRNCWRKRPWKLL